MGKRNCEKESEKENSDKECSDECSSSAGGFVCPTCAKVYAQSSSLSRHVLSHVNSEPFKCTKCNKYETDRKDSLTRHMRKCEGGDKEWKCEKCNKTFAFQSYLNRHRCAATCPTCQKKVSDSEKHECRLLVKLPQKRKRPREHGSTSSGACAYPASSTIPPVNLSNLSNLSNLCNLFSDIWSEPSEYMSHEAIQDEETTVPVAIGGTFLSYSMVDVAVLDSTLLHCVYCDAGSSVGMFAVPLDEQPPVDFIMESPAIRVDDVSPAGPNPACVQSCGPVCVLSDAVFAEQQASSASLDERPAHVQPRGSVTVLSQSSDAVFAEQQASSASLDERPPQKPATEGVQVSRNTLNKRRIRAADIIADKIRAECDKSDLDEESVVNLVLKRLKLTVKFKHIVPFVNQIPYTTRLCVWEFWHQVSDESTLTTSLARLRETERPGVQADLKFADSVESVLIRNRKFYRSQWKTYAVPLLELLMKYCKENDDKKVSTGKFIALRPFYIRSVSLKDIEMCCCKLHLHMRWAINAIIKIASKLEIAVPFTNYSSFFQMLYANCEEIENTYISWSCTPNNKRTCEDIASNYSTCLQLLENADPGITVSFTHFEKQIQTDADGKVILNKKDKPVKRLVPVKNKVNAQFLIQFFHNILPEAVHHRNMLRLYRNLKHAFIANMGCIYIDIDFSENLTIGIKWEPQSCHWNKLQVTIHSGLVIFNGVKVYHPYVSNDRLHDQVFVHQALLEIFSTIDIPDGIPILVESDNCSGQYKSCQHFYHLQSLSNQLNCDIVRLYGIAGHGKGEVDHVGGIAKIAVRKEIAAGEVFQKSEPIVSFLEDRFREKECPSYHICEITEEALNKEREEDHRRVFKTVDGSSDFHVCVFTPNNSQFKASPRLCLCNKCSVNYGSCDLFKSYELQVQELNPTHLRSHITPQPPLPLVTDNEEVHEFIVPGTVVVIAREKGGSNETPFWFMEVLEVNRVEFDEEKRRDSYGRIVPEGVAHISGVFLEKSDRHSNMKKTVYTKSKNVSFFYKESILYPYVNMVPGKNGLTLSSQDYIDILVYIEKTGYTHL